MALLSSVCVIGAGSSGIAPAKTPHQRAFDFDCYERADIRAERAAMFKRYVTSARHTMQVDFDDYVLATRQERRRGARRAALAGHRLPVAPRAAAAA
jgi:hypothetical protein